MARLALALIATLLATSTFCITQVAASGAAAADAAAATITLRRVTLVMIFLPCSPPGEAVLVWRI